MHVRSEKGANGDREARKLALAYGAAAEGALLAVLARDADRFESRFGNVLEKGGEGCKVDVVLTWNGYFVYMNLKWAK